MSGCAKGLPKSKGSSTQHKLPPLSPVLLAEYGSLSSADVTWYIHDDAIEMSRCSSVMLLSMIYNTSLLRTVLSASGVAVYLLIMTFIFARCHQGHHSACCVSSESTPCHPRPGRTWGTAVVSKQLITQSRSDRQLLTSLSGCVSSSSSSSISSSIPSAGSSSAL